MVTNQDASEGQPTSAGEIGSGIEDRARDIAQIYKSVEDNHYTRDLLLKNFEKGVFGETLRCALTDTPWNGLPPTAYCHAFDRFVDQFVIKRYRDPLVDVRLELLYEAKLKKYSLAKRLVSTDDPVQQRYLEKEIHRTSVYMLKIVSELQRLLPRHAMPYLRNEFEA